MALTAFQRAVCRLLASSRRERESYVAGGVALNKLLASPRLSRDIDLFHDTKEALVRTVAQDREILSTAGYGLRFLRETPTYAEAELSQGAESTLIQWVHDSAYRFFPLIEDDDLGLTLHALDLATNKVLAMAGRLEARDWIDVMTCHDGLQPLGYLVWAACGKDPGYGPSSLLQEIRRGSLYSQAEMDLLSFEGTPPDAKALGSRWHGLLGKAQTVCELLPVDEVGTCVITRDGELCRLSPEDLEEGLRDGRVAFHRGRIGGAWPTFPEGTPPRL